MVNPEGKDLSQFATKATMQAEMKAARSAGIEPEFTGEGTAFSTAVPDASKFACANKQIPPEAKEMFAAINANQWAEGEHCGECVEVWCVSSPTIVNSLRRSLALRSSTRSLVRSLARSFVVTFVRCEDAFCPTRFKPQVLKVYDLCPECADGDLDLSNEAYEKVTGRWPHRVKIAWRWLSRDECNAHFDPGNEIRMVGIRTRSTRARPDAPTLTRSLAHSRHAPRSFIRQDLKDSHNKYYRGFFFSMAADRIASVKLDGRELTPSQFGFWEDFSGAELESGPVGRSEPTKIRR